MTQSPTWTIWRPICGMAEGLLDEAALAGIAAQHENAFDGTGSVVVVSGPSTGDEEEDGPMSRGGGLNIVFNVAGEPPPGALAALDAAAAYVESKFADPVMVEIDLEFASLGPNIIGQTGYAVTVPPSPQWTTARAALVADMDADDLVQNWLPSGATVPVRWDASSPNVSNVSGVILTVENLSALDYDTTAHTSMTINDQFAFDFDPTDGIDAGAFCFQSVIVHEIGHALGFFSVLDSFPAGVTAMDLFRFQWTDGEGTDWNPDTFEEFQTTARTIDSNNPDDDVLSDLIEVEYRMSDGDPNQASHLRRQTPLIGNMAPTIAAGATRYPSFFRRSDLAILDAIGWDYVAPPRGDMDVSGVIDVNDIGPFVNALLGNPAGTDIDEFQADMNDDYVQDGADVALFIAALLN